MEKRGLARSAVVLLLVLVVIAVIALFVVLRKPVTVAYSDDPEDWVDDLGNNVKSVDVEEATKGTSYLDTTSQQYDDSLIITSFAYDGLYDGEWFDTIKFDKDSNMVMAIRQNMKPGNGIIEGFIIEKIDRSGGERVIADIFVDSDWKELVGENTNIVWGKNYQNIKKFEFDEISKGIFMDSVEDDRERFNSDYTIHEGGVIVGNLSLDDVKNKNVDGLTLIRVN